MIRSRVCRPEMQEPPTEPSDTTRDIKRSTIRESRMARNRSNRVSTNWLLNRDCTVIQDLSERATCLKQNF